VAAATVFTASFWRDAAERAIKSAAQAGILALGGGAVDVLTLDWATLAGAAGGGALLSMLTSIASVTVTQRGTASLSRSVEPVEPAA